MKSLLQNHNLILLEAAIVEQLRRMDEITLHPNLVNALLIYDDKGKRELQKLYQSYMSIAIKAGLPFLMCAPTWRANDKNVKESQVNPNINSDAVCFMQDIRDAQGLNKTMIRIGGLLGCKNDCYKPEQGLSESEASQFHSWQIEKLAQAGVDFLMAETLPNVEEAVGIAKAMGKTTIPYIISFVINRNGFILDGTSLWDAIKRIDAATSRRPLCYMVNCSYPTFLCAEKQPVDLFTRLMGYEANASSLDHSDLDGSEQLQTESVADWGREMLILNKKYGVKILGGCCGTGVAHLQYLTENR